jgi:site-specific DNA-methyltransferase (adenine-specific)
MSLYYEDDLCQLYHGDSREVLPKLGKFNLLLTDPPYGVNWNTNYSRFSRGTKDRLPIANDARSDLDIESFFDFADEQIVFGANCIAISRPGSFLVWDKRCADGFSLLSDAEVAWWSEGRGVYIKPINAQRHRSRSGLHPTQKPVELMTWCLSKAKAKGSVIDPFAGSGTTLLAAKLEGRKCVGIEINEDYCKIAAKRLSQKMLTFDSNDSP